MTKKNSEPKVKTKKRRLWLKIPLYTLLFILIIIACLPLYSFLFIPTITNIVEQQTGRKVSLDGLSVNAFAASIYIDNLQLKEKDGTDNFVKIEKLDFDVSVISLLFGNIELAHGEISGVHVNVTKNEKGEFNFKSILDNLPKGQSSEQKDTKAPQEKESKPLESLPYLGAKVMVNNVNVNYKDLQEKNSFVLENLNFTCNVAGLNNIGYQSNWKGAKYESSKSKETSAGVIYRLSGNAGVGIKNGKWFASSKGDLLFSDVYARGFGEKDIDKTSLKVAHEIAVDLEQGVCEIKNIDIDCDYVTFKVTQTKIDNLQLIEDNVPSLLSNKDYQGLKAFFEKLPIEGWSGDIHATVDIDQVKQDFGEYIASVSKEQLTDFGGKIVFHTKLENQKNIFAIHESLTVENLYASGSLTKDEVKKPYRVGLKSLQQDFVTKVNFADENATTTISLDVTTLDAKKLMTAKLDTSIRSIFDPQNTRVEKHEDKFMLDFDVLSSVIKDFLPKDTQLKGKMENFDMLTYSPEKGMSISGNTNIKAKVISPKIADLPELNLQGDRNFEVAMQNQKVQKITIKKLDMKTIGSDIFKLEGKGLLNLDGDNKQGLQVDLNINFNGLQKYIEPLNPNIGVQGKVFHKTTLAQKGDKVRLEGNGEISSFVISLGEGTVPYDIPKATWKHDLIASLKDNKPENAQVRVAFEHPALSLNVLGTLGSIQTEPLAFKLEQTKVDSKVIDGIEIGIESDFSKIPFFVKKIIAQSGIQLSKLEGKFKNTTTLSGDLNNLKIKNEMRLKSDIALALKENKNDVETISPAIPLEQGVESIILIAIDGLQDYLAKKSEMKIGLHPKSYFSLKQGNNDFVNVQLKGNIGKGATEVNLEGVEVATTVYGKSIQSSIPVNFVARDDANLKETFQNLKLDGDMSFVVRLDGNPKDLKVSLKEDLTNFVVQMKDPKKGLLVDKKRDFALSYQANIHLLDKGNTKEISMSSTPKFGSSNISMGSLMIKQSPDSLDITDENGQKAKILVLGLSFAELNKILPIIKTLKLENARLDLSIQEVVAHTKTKDFGGKLLCTVLVPEADLPHIQKTLGMESAKPKQENIELPVDKNKVEDTEQPIITLSQEVRDILKKLGVDIKVIVEKAKLDAANNASDLRVDISMNQEKPDNQFLFDVNGKTNTGTLSIVAKADLDREHPKCSFKSDIDQVPYVVSLFAPISDRLNDVVKFPLFQKMDFGSAEKVTFSLKGENNWTGLDPRVIKKSLFSAGETSLQISGGKFDLGFDMSKFVNADELMKGLESELAPLKSSLSQLSGQSTGTKSQITGLQSSLVELQANIQPVIDQKRSLENTINDTQSQLDSIGFDFGGVLKKTLEKSKKALSSYDQQIATYEQEKKKIETSLQSLQAELGKIEGGIAKLQNNIKAKQDELMAKMKIDNPFSFDFGSLYIAFKVTNDSPYGGESTDWSPHPFSKVNYVEVSFTPKGQPFPAIKGWYSLDGGYNFNFLPAAEYMKNIRETAPMFADFLSKENGVSWGSSGFNY